MKEVIVKIYEFEELSKKAQDKAIDLLYDVNVDYDWWESTYEDAANVGLKITGFNLYRNSAEGEFTLSANEVAANILKEHGETCETFKTAENFMKEWQPVFDAYMDENDERYESTEAEVDLSNLEDEFLKSLLEDYIIILSKEYDYLCSREAIIEAIEANEYLFTEDGKIYHI